MTGFLISHPDIVARSLYTRSTHSFTDYNTHFKNEKARRTARTKLATDSSDLHVMEYDLGVGTLTKAAQFVNGLSQYLTRADESDLSFGDEDFTISGWIYFDTLTANRALVGKYYTTSPNREYLIYYDSSVAEIYFTVSNNGTATTSIASKTDVGHEAIAVGRWYFVTAWHDSAANVIGLQINEKSSTKAHTTGCYNGIADFNIGAYDNGASARHDGKIQRVGLWRRVLTSTERGLLYNLGAGRDYDQLTTGLLTSLIEFWPLNETSGTRTGSHAAKTLTASGGPLYGAGQYRRERTADHFIIARADKLLSNTAAIVVRQSNASFFYPTSSLFTSYMDGARGITLTAGKVSAWADQLALLANFTQGSAAARPWLTLASNREERFRKTAVFSSASVWDVSSYPCSISGNTLTATASAARHGMIYYSNDGERLSDNVTTLILSAHLQYVNNQYAWVGESGDGPWRGVIVDLVNGTITNSYNVAASSISARSGGGYIVKVQYLTTACTNHTPGVWFSNTSSSSSPPSFTPAGTEQITIHEMHWRSTLADDVDLANSSDTSLFRGMNGNRVLHFQGAQYASSASLLSAIIAAGSGVIYLGQRSAKITSNQMVFSDANTHLEFWITGSNMRAENNDGAADNISIATAVDTPTIWRWRHSGGVLYFAKDTGQGFGPESSIASGNTTALTGALLVGAYTGPAGFYFGDVFCIATSSGGTADPTLEQLLRDRFLKNPLTSELTLSSATLVGPDAQDLLKEFTESHMSRYFTVEYVPASSGKFERSTVALGKYFDLDREPSLWQLKPDLKISPNQSASGGENMAKVRDVLLTPVFSWTLVANTVLADLRKLINYCRANDLPVFLRSSTTPEQVDSFTMIETTPGVFEFSKDFLNRNSVDLKFEEQRG